MKKMTRVLGVVAISFLSFSFTTKSNVQTQQSNSSLMVEAEDQPKVVILDIVDNIASEGTNIATELKNRLQALNKENVQVVLWKEITKDLEETEKGAIIDSLKPELIMTLNFDKTDDNTNKVAAVVSKQNVAFQETLKVAKELAEEINSPTLKNDGVYQTDSKYIQDNAAPSIFLSLKVKNEPASNVEIINKISNFIEKAQISNNHLPKLPIQN